MPDSGFVVIPDQLRAAAALQRTCADATAGNAEELAGAQNSPNGSARGFECMSTATALAQGWVRSVEVVAANLAVTADRLEATAAHYLVAEAKNTRLFSQGQG
jgi:hypothetical protein